MTVTTSRDFTQDYLDYLVEAGAGFHVSVGAFSTPITGGGAGTILDLDQPEFVLGIPSTIALVPTRIIVACQAPLLAADSEEIEILIAVDKASGFGVTAAADGTATTEVQFNMRTNQTAGSKCVARSAFTADMTTDGTNDPVLGIELDHAVKVGDVQGTAANAMWTELRLHYEPLRPPRIVGPATLLIYFGGTVATTGFAMIEWVEIPLADLPAVI